MKKSHRSVDDGDKELITVDWLVGLLLSLQEKRKRV